jgi:formylglycine-generating enzyme required for sulfatase activity
MTKNIFPNRRRIAWFAMLLMVLLLMFSPSARLSASLPQVGADARPKPKPAPKESTPARTTRRRSTRTNSGTTTTSVPTGPRMGNVPRAGALIRNQMGMEFAYVPAGSFLMGSENGKADEKPVHQVTFREGFYIGRYEVTQAQWQAVMGNNPSNFKGDNLPVEQVSWNDAQEFIRKLNARSDGFTYRLPTEAEWEYACRADSTTEFALGNSLSSKQANFDGNYPYGRAAKGVYRQKTTPGGSFQPNAWGLYDMHGNVMEWCEDWYHDSYNGAPTDGSVWLSAVEQEDRVLRDGSWNDSADVLRSAFRGFGKPMIRNVKVGFRLVAVART